MAKIKFGAFMVDARGKVGGTVFSKNRTGAYTRNKVTPVNRNSVRQGLVRTAFGFLSQQWRQLTEPARAAWREAANNVNRTNIFGDTVKLTGQQMFVSVNQNRAIAQQPFLAEPGEAGGVMELGLVEAMLLQEPGSDDRLTLLTEPPELDDVTGIAIYATRPLSAGVNFVGRSDFRLIGYFPPTTQLFNEDLLQNYAAVFGTFPPESANQKVFLGYRLINQNNGVGAQNISPVAVQYVVV